MMSSSTGTPLMWPGTIRHLAMVDNQRPGWQDRAVCAETDPEIYFPEKGGSSRRAKLVCRSCPVRSECLEDALLDGQQWGVWGGTTEQERDRIKRDRAREAAA